MNRQLGGSSLHENPRLLLLVQRDCNGVNSRLRVGGFYLPAWRNADCSYLSELADARCGPLGVKVGAPSFRFAYSYAHRHAVE